MISLSARCHAPSLRSPPSRHCAWCIVTYHGVPWTCVAALESTTDHPGESDADTAIKVELVGAGHSRRKGSMPMW